MRQSPDHQKNILSANEPSYDVATLLSEARANFPQNPEIIATLKEIASKIDDVPRPIRTFAMEMLGKYHTGSQILWGTEMWTAIVTAFTDRGLASNDEMNKMAA